MVTEARDTSRQPNPRRARPRLQSDRRHYHLVDSPIGEPRSYVDEIFPSRRAAEAAARGRAQWLATAGGLCIHALERGGRYLVTSGRRDDPGRLIAVEECDDPACVELAYESMC